MYGDQFGEFVCGYWDKGLMLIRKNLLFLPICIRVDTCEISLTSPYIMSIKGFQCRPLSMI